MATNDTHIPKSAGYSIDDLQHGILSGNRRLLAKGISLVESTRPDDFHKSQRLLERLLPATGNSRRIGITGVPGVGKSTFIDTFGMMLIQQGHRVAVLAVDPSSTRSGGSILGDKTRMGRLARQENAFIRPSPSSGSLGGVARTTRETMLLCEAAGFDTILVETVGVGQSEITVASMVDFFLVLMLANAGDDLQGIKRGIMEMADAIAINKSDGDHVRVAKSAQAYLRSALHLLAPKYPDWTVPVLLCSALEHTGMESIFEVLHRFFERADTIQHNRLVQAKEWLHSLVHSELHTLVAHNPAVQALLPTAEQAVMNQQQSPAAAAHAIVQGFLRSLCEQQKDSSDTV